MFGFKTCLPLSDGVVSLLVLRGSGIVALRLLVDVFGEHGKETVHSARRVRVPVCQGE